MFSVPYVLLSKVPIEPPEGCIKDLFYCGVVAYNRVAVGRKYQMLLRLDLRCQGGGVLCRKGMKMGLGLMLSCLSSVLARRFMAAVIGIVANLVDLY